MRFHLDHTPTPAGFELTHGKKIALLGSCFSENIATKLIDYRFTVLNNPHGVLFNPSSIHECLDTIVNEKLLDEKHLVYRDGNFFSYLHHSSVHDENKHNLLKKVNHQTINNSEFLKKTDCLLITFGSAFVYHHLGLNMPVANCHKQPGSTFEKKMLTVEEITGQYTLLLRQIKKINPAIRVVFTVSPVKYLKDGVIENTMSKSTLLLSVHQLVQTFAFCSYFPAFELVTDDLRDYRFYKEDLAHPNEQAINYVWEKFAHCFFSESTRSLNKQLLALNQALNHRKLISNSEEAIKLNDFIIKQKAVILKINPEIDFNH